MSTAGGSRPTSVSAVAHADSAAQDVAELSARTLEQWERNGFVTVGLERIIGATMATNLASRRVMEKCGLRFQGELAMAGTTVVWYAIDRRDWQSTPAPAGSSARRWSQKRQGPRLGRNDGV
jgi:hypothetical protein